MIELRHLTKQFDGAETASVRDFDLTIADGEFMVLIGESGCGKTTTLNMINRLVDPSDGQILIDGEDALTIEPVALRRRMGFVFQAIGLFPHLTVAENVAITPRLLNWAPDEIAGRVDELLDLMRLDPEQYRDRFPAELSGGQRQRVGLARALAARPKIMLMDEPFGALDPLTRDDLSADYRAVHEQLGLTTILVTHDMTEAFLLADRVAVMRDGRAGRRLGRPHELLAAPADDFVKTLVETPRRRARLLAKAHGNGRSVMSGTESMIAAAFANLPNYLGQHVLLSVSSIALGLLISLPLAISASRIAWLRGPVLGVASVIQTIPSLALLALFYPLLLAISTFTEDAFGAGFRALGFLPALLALTLYSMLPVLRNTITGLIGIDPAILMAARGVGMTPRQSMFLVELPLAAPVIMAGIRTAAVWVIGTATLSTPVGQTSLGNYIFTGLQTENWVFVLFGCFAAAILALVDRPLAGAGRNPACAAALASAGHWRRRRARFL